MSLNQLVKNGVSSVKWGGVRLVSDVSQVFERDDILALQELSKGLRERKLNVSISIRMAQR